MERMPEEGTLKKSIRGGNWMLVNTLIQRGVSIASFLILARLLTPEDFGIIAIVLLIPPLLELLLTIDFESAIIQRQDNPQSYLDTLWTLNVVKSLFVFLVIFFAGPFIANFFHADSATLAIRLGGIFIFIQGFGNVAQIIFFKELDFKKIFVRDIVTRLAYVTSAVGFAWYLKSYWALFWANAAFAVTGLIIIYILLPYRPRFSFDMQKLKNLFGYSKWLYGQGILGELVSTVEQSMIGRLLGAGELGLYIRAKALASTPTAPIASIINKVSFPAYARIKESITKAKDGYLKSLDVLFLFAIPFPFFALLGGERLVLILLGAQWVALTPLFQIFTVAAIFQIVASTSSSLFNAFGRPDIQLKASFIQFAFLILFFLLLTPIYGAWGTALGVLIAWAIVSVFVINQTKNILEVKWREFLGTVTVPIAASFISGIIWYQIFTSGWAFTNQTFLLLLTFFALTYLLIVIFFGMIFNSGPLQTFRLIIKRFWS